MKAVKTALIIVCMFLLPGATAYAETNVTITESGPDTQISAATVVDWGAEDTDNHAAAPVREIPAGRQPVSVEQTTENGVTIIKKTYELSPDADPQTLVQPFERDGLRFAAREILRRDTSGEPLTRLTSKTAAIVSDTDDIAEVIQQFPDTVSYEQDGYTGRLRLDSTSLVIEPDGYETYAYPFTRTRDIPGLARNDPALIEREWNGMTLSGVTFRQGADGRYTATAAYRGMATGRRPASFIATVNYYGEVSKSMSGNILYTVIYEQLTVDSGELTVNEHEPTERPAAGTVNGQLFAIIFGVVILIGAAFALPYAVQKLRKERNQSHETINETKRFIKND